MKIYKKLLEIQKKLQSPKGQYNAFGKYKYRSCEDVLQTLKPFLAEQGLTLMLSDQLENIGERFYISAEAVLVDNETGETIKTKAYAREEETKKGMDGSQITGASSSYARKYALNGMFLIDDNKDSDDTNTGNEKADENKKNEPKKELTENELRKAYIDTINKYQKYFKAEIKKLLEDGAFEISDVPTENLKALATKIKEKIKNDKELQKIIKKEK